MKAIKAHVTDFGELVIPPDAQTEDWNRVKSRADLIIRVDRLTGCGEYTSSFQVDGDIYLVAE